MSSEYATADCLSDIVENAERVARYLVGIDHGAFRDNGLLRDAVERCVERVCEAAFRPVHEPRS